MFNIISSILIPAPPIFHGKLSGGEAEKKKTKIPKNSENKPRDLYFSKALFEGLIFGGAYVRREICVSKSIGLALWLEVDLPFLSVLLNVFEGNFQVQAPRGDYI